MPISALDIGVMIVYLAGITAIGVFAGGKQHSSKDYFVSEKAVPWIAVCFAIVATETSALTFLSLPGLAFVGNFNFLQLGVGYILGRIIVSWLLLPRYFEGELSTAYEYLQRRFNPIVRRTASVTFMGTRLFADGVRLYTTAIPIAILLGSSQGGDSFGLYVGAIVLLSALTLLYVFFGGVRAVIWTDVIQLFLYLSGAVISIVVLMDLLPGTFGEAMAQANQLGKLEIFPSLEFSSFSEFLKDTYSVPASIFGGMFLSMSSHGVDQLIIQRVLATNNLRKARAALTLSGFVVTIQFAVFLVVGTLLFLFFGSGEYGANDVFAQFIIEYIPVGFTGLIIAGLLAAAMSTLSGSISSLSSTTVLDLFVPLSKKEHSQQELLKISRLVSIGWCIAIALSAVLFINTQEYVVELALSIASITYGSLLGLFLMGSLQPRVNSMNALHGFVTGMAAMVCIFFLTEIAWTWYVAIGAIVSSGTAQLSAIILPSRKT